MMEERAPIDVGDAGRDITALSAALAGRYVIERELGRGGMAAVYLARDVRHHRQVAVKALHPELAAVLGAARFLAEIRTTAALQHPHVLPLFDSGEAGGQLFYVMPYVAGEPLRARLTRERQLPIAEALRLAREVASALDYAHRHGVVHRDVKPENILLDEEGQALVADFGIALAVSHAGGERMTQSGLSLGTPQYMAPEQAAGERTVDARADVYALGAVTYEMLAGAPPFVGPTAQAVIAKLMTEEPPALTRLRRTAPPHVEAAVMRALEKLPADRFPSAGAFAAALAESAAPRESVRPRPITRDARGLHLSMPMVAMLGIALVAAGAALGAIVGSRALAPAVSMSMGGPVRFALEPDSGFLGSGDWWYSPPAISPDGRTIVFAATRAGGARLYARSVDDLTARALPGTEGGDWPFFSPDGAWVGFANGGAIRKVRLDGGTPDVVAELPPSVGTFFGGSWFPNDTIVFTVFFSGALYRVPAAGGTPKRIAVDDTTRHLMHPSPLPGGRALLVTSSADWRIGRVGVLDLATGAVRRFGPGIGAHYVAGHIIYAGGSGALYRQAFDLDRMAPSGPAEEIASGLDVSLAGWSPLDVSPTGALAYRAGGSWKVTLTDRAGREQQTLPARFPWAPRFSPDGRRIAYAAFAPGPEGGDVWSGEVWRTDIWITDLESGTMQRLTTDGNDNSEPQWSPDGRAIAHSADLVGAKDVFVRTFGGDSGGRVTRRPGEQRPSDWTPDGRAVLFNDYSPGLFDTDIWIQPIDGTAAQPYVTRQGNQTDARVSPDGHWAAYESDETGRLEVYLESYPTPGQKLLVSTEGGKAPAWRRDGGELYYWQRDQLIAVSLGRGRGGELPSIRGRTHLFRTPRMDAAGYDVSPDGTRFAIVTGGPRANRLVVALNVLGRRPPRPAR